MFLYLLILFFKKRVSAEFFMDVDLLEEYTIQKGVSLISSFGRLRDWLFKNIFLKIFLLMIVFSFMFM